jgi:hypothetical protein
MLKRYLDLETNYADIDSRLFLIMLDADNFKASTTRSDTRPATGR